MDEEDLKKIETLFRHHIGILSEDFQHKLDIVAEGHEMLVERLENTRVELKEEIQKVGQRLTMAEANLSQKIEGISADLAVHRGDTEIHRTHYEISERKD
jgi:hypothetical protein